MNEQTLHKTRSHLTRMFTGIVVCLMLIVGIVFLTARYVTESHRTSEQFTRETRQIFTTAASAKNFLESF